MTYSVHSQCAATISSSKTLSLLQSKTFNQLFLIAPPPALCNFMCWQTNQFFLHRKSYIQKNTNLGYQN